MKHEHSGKHEQQEHGSHKTGGRHYLHLAMMAVLSFIAMYALMYAMVNALQNVYMNVNQFYMAGLMTAPMVVIELILMRQMYPSKKLNVSTMVASVIAAGAFWTFIRGQTAVGNEQFLRSMIPHHAGAILMCDEASVTDPEIKRLCESIRKSQQEEIDLMKAKLSQLKSK